MDLFLQIDAILRHDLLEKKSNLRLEKVAGRHIDEEWP